ncbi:MAG: hypothetical protein EOM40_17585 [Clostridia bacterium]|nr:hypothetical protein [Clostridia bacterium]NCC43292.1 hypothetical protein [Clostridia bacterium]
MRNRKRKKHSWKIIGLDIAIAVMTVLIVVTGLAVMGTYDDATSYRWETSRFLNTIKENDYLYCIEGYYANEMHDYKADGELQECYGVSRYFEASYWYEVYENVGDTKKAREALETKEKAKEKTGSLSAVTDRIDRIFAE